MMTAAHAHQHSRLWKNALLGAANAWLWVQQTLGSVHVRCYFNNMPKLEHEKVNLHANNLLKNMILQENSHDNPCNSKHLSLHTS